MPHADNPDLASFEDIASDYLKRWGTSVEQEQKWFGARPKILEDAVERACLSQIPSGRGGGLKRHSHQTRIPWGVLAEAKLHVLARQDDLSECRSFADLFDIIERTIRPIPGVGELLVYDVAQRIGAFLNLEPDKVYLHAGTRKGARALGLETKRKAIPLAELPAGLRRLKPSQLEDVLCIYCAAIIRVQSGETAARPARRC